MKYIPLFFIACFLLSVQAAFSQDTKPGEFYSLRDKQMMAGIDFYASNSKPGWSLEIDFEKAIVFVPGGDTIKSSFEKLVETQQGKTTIYKLQADAKDIIIKISRDQCKTRGSKVVSGYKVTVDTKNVNARDYQHYRGCGNYLPDYRLNNIWLVKTIKGTDLSKLYGPNNQAVVEYHLSENTVMGNTGCDEYSGNISFLNHQIVFGKLAGGKLQCKDENPEKIFLKTLSKKTLHYHFEEGLLKLFENKKVVMILKPVD